MTNPVASPHDNEGISAEQLNPSNAKHPPRFEFFVAEQTADGISYSPMPLDVSNAESIMGSFAQLRELILDYDSDSEGIDTASVDAFLADVGVRVPASIYLEGDQKESLVEVLTMFGLDISGEELGGKYLPEVDIAVIFRDRELERLNGPGFSESVDVHERFHGAIAYSDTVRVAPSADGEREIIRLSQYGPVERPLPSSTEEEPETIGVFWYEAGAELMRGKYVHDTHGPGGFTSYIDGVIVDASGVPIPSKYLFAWQPGEYTYFDPAFAAVGLEMLAERDPELISALVRSCNSMAGLEEFKSRVNAITPGLYETVQDTYNGYGEHGGASFNEGALCIIGALADTDSSASQIRADDNN